MKHRFFTTLALAILAIFCTTTFAQDYTTVQEWTFDGGTAEGWEPGRHLKELVIENGTIGGTAEGKDPH